MSSFDELVAALGARKQEIYGTNPWTLGGNALAKQDFYDPQSSTASNLGAALLTGLGGGFARGYGRKQSEQEYLDEATALGSALDMQGPQRMEAVDANPALQPYKPLILLGQKRDEEEQAQMLAKIQQQKDMIDYQQKSKADHAIAKPLRPRVSEFEMKADYIDRTLGPEAAKKYKEKELGLSIGAVETDPAKRPEKLEDFMRTRVWAKGEDRKGATKELGKLEEIKDATDNIKTSWGRLKGLKAIDSLNPIEDNWNAFQGAILDVLPALKPIFGQLSSDEKRFVMQNAPKSLEQPEATQGKIDRMVRFLRQRAQTPTLNSTLGSEVMAYYRPKYLGDDAPNMAPQDAPIEEAQDSAGAAWRIIRGPNGQPIGKVRK